MAHKKTANKEARADAVGQAYEDTLQELNWNELSKGEKIERMREIVKAQRTRLDSLAQHFNALERALRNHGHLEGRVMLSFDGRDDRGWSTGEVLDKQAAGDNCYF